MFNQANLYAYEFAMITVGVAGLILCTAFLRTGLIPRPLAVWGLVGYLVILTGSVLQVLGFDLHSIHAIPGGLWEGFIGVWLIVKGFNTPTVPLETHEPRRPPPPAFDGELHALTSDVPGRLCARINQSQLRQE